MEFDHLVIHTKTKQQPSTTISLLASLYQIVVSPFKPNIVWDSNTNDKSLLDLTAMHNLYRN
jgi:CII-binding regulator of phage lambda lysogenization HflD